MLPSSLSIIEYIFCILSGKSSDITGDLAYYSGGGAGSGQTRNGGGGGNWGNAGIGGGGSRSNGQAGTGGGGASGYSGGSGLIIIAYNLLCSVNKIRH